MERVNKTLDIIPNKLKRQLTLRKIQSLVINPSQDITLIARKHFNQLPGTLKFFLRRIGIDGKSGNAILSYILFESSFTRELIALGYEDTKNREQEIKSFYQM